MNRFYSLALLCICILTPLFTFSQDSYKKIEKDLKSLEGSLYIKRAVEGASEMVQEKNFDKAKDLLNKAVKKSKSSGNATQAVVMMTKANLMADQFPRESKYIKEIVKTVDESIKRQKSEMILNDALQIYSKIYSVADSKLDVDEKIADLRLRLGKIEQESKKLEGEKLAKNLAIESKGEAALEIKKLQDERERLENVTTELSESVVLNEKLLNRRKAIIRKMSREKSANEAVLQYNLRIIDSLEFSAKLDSINILNGQHLISEQKSKLELAQSELKVKDAELELKNSRQKLYLVLSILGLLTAGFLAFIIFASRKTNKRLQEKQVEIEKEKERAEDLLLNILPEFIALELKEKSRVETKFIDHCTVMFTDFINFSHISKQLSPKELIETLDECFREFDKISSSFNIEKIKTIGDSYMCASGVPIPSKTHALDAIHAAQKMVDFLEGWNAEREKNNKIRFDARIGIHSGPVIAGVVGMKKFAYDIWGDTVNVAARIESQSSAQRINISSSTYELTKDYFNYESRGKIAVKNMNELNMYYLDKEGKRAIPRISTAS